MNGNLTESNEPSANINSSIINIVENTISDLSATAPLVSIIVPVYNVELFLEQCIQSLTDQTYKQFEVILINDGSTDNSLNICKTISVKDSRFKIINQNNQGASVARNIGLKSANGEFILFVDSDDFISQNSLEILVSNIQNNDSDICIFDKLFWFYNKNQIKEFKLTSEFQHCNCDEALLIDDIHLYSPCTKLYRRALLEDITFPEGLLHEDVFHWIAVMSKKPKISLAPNSIYYYRKNDASITRIGNNMKLRKSNLSKSFNLGVDFALKNNVSDEFKICLLNTFFLFFPYPSEISLEDEKEIVGKLISAIPPYKRLSYGKCKVVNEYQFLFKIWHLDKRFLRINLFPRYQRYIIDFSFKLAGSYTFQFIIGRAV